MPVSSSRSLPIIDDAMQVARAVADQHRALDRRADLAVLQLVGLGALEDVLARRDVDLSAAERHRVDAVLHRRDDLLRIAAAREHVGVGHARHRHVARRFRAVRCRSASCPSGARSAGPACSRRGCRPRSARCLLVGVPSSSMVSEPRRSVIVPSSTTVTPLAATCWPSRPGEGRGLLAIEVAFEPVADRLVQHHAGPAGAEHDVEFAGRGGDGFEIDQRLTHRVVDRAPSSCRSAMKRA